LVIVCTAEVIKMLNTESKKSGGNMATLQSVLAEKIPVWREELRDFLKEHGDEVISELR